MKNKLPAILFLLCIPLSMAVFMWVAKASDSEILGLASAVGIYMLAGVLISAFCGKSLPNDSKESKKNEILNRDKE